MKCDSKEMFNFHSQPINLASILLSSIMTYWESQVYVALRNPYYKKKSQITTTKNKTILSTIFIYN